ncbi:MAG: dTDP-glucose 4,6-dehydratase [Bacteroidales bacterium]
MGTQQKKTLLITGGAGFIGSHVVRKMVTTHPSYRVVNLDELTYAGNLENLKDVEGSPNYTFVKGNIVDEAFLEDLFSEYSFNGVIHLAAESHVDRSITDPMDFIRTNIVGTVHLLNCCRSSWEDPAGRLFFHISTDEVYGSLGKGGSFTETTPYDPRSPYSASKASSDHLVRAYYHTYGLPVVVSNCSNNYGPNQFPEKLIPLAINNILHKKPIPIYGKGENVRDWLYVEDHAEAIDLILHKGKVGRTYNIGGMNEWKNIDLIFLLCSIMDEKLDRDPGTSAKLVTFVKDRAGHDLRYSMDTTRISTELQWKPSHTFEQGLSKTVDWYLSNQDWMKRVTSGAYQAYYDKQYANR